MEQVTKIVNIWRNRFTYNGNRCRAWVTLAKILVVTLFLLLLCWDGYADEWAILSNHMDNLLDKQEETLHQLQSQIEKAKASNDEMSVLLIELQMQNDTLRTFNEQIGERMYERDMELFDCYKEIDKQKAFFRSLLSVTVLLGAIVVMFVLIKVFVL